MAARRAAATRFPTSPTDPLESWRDVGSAGAAWADGGDGNVLTGRTPGIPLDDRGRAQAGALAARLADVPLDAIITSPLDRCRETAEAIAAARDGSAPEVTEDEQFAEVKYGDWTGQPLKRLAKDPLWRVVQAHPSAVRFPGRTRSPCPRCSTAR